MVPTTEHRGVDRAVLPAACLVLLAGIGHAADKRPAKPLEVAYVVLAAELENASICELISADAKIVAPAERPGQQISYAKSLCYQNLTMATGDGSFCEQVVTLEGAPLDGSGVSREACLTGLAEGMKPRTHHGLYDVQRQLGFPDRQSPRCFQYPGWDGGRAGRLPPDLSTRVRFLPDFSTPAPDVEGLRAKAQEHDLEYRREKVNHRHFHGRTTLYDAAYRGDLACVRTLLELGADVAVRDDLGYSPLHQAAAGGNTDAIRLLLDRGSDPKAKADDGVTPVHSAAQSGHNEAIGLLVAAGGELDTVDHGGRTPLWWAAHRRADETTRYLLERGADASAAGGDVVLQAIRSDDLALVRLLLERGASLDVSDDWGQTPLHIAAYYGSTDSLRFLLERELAVNVRDPQRRTPLHQAARSGKLESYKLILSAGGDPELRDGRGKRPIDDPNLLIRTIEGRLPADEVAYLFDSGASPDVPDATGRSPLQVAIEARNANAVELLLERGADTGVMTRSGQSLSELAATRKARMEQSYEKNPCTRSPDDIWCDDEKQKWHDEWVRDIPELQRIIDLLQ